jgi:hypothetical protein
MMSNFPTGSSKVVLLDSGTYPNFSNFLNETWTFNGTDWSYSGATLDAGGPLPGRVDAVMAYDGTNVILFGGRGASSADGVLADTWAWNGTAWSKKSPATSPFGRYKAEAAYLSGTGLVMFGGRTINDMLLETWVWNGTTWSQVALANRASPPARVDFCMSAGTSSIVVFGGSTTNQQLLDTWSFNGTTWTKLAPATSPAARSNAAMAYATNASLHVMFGGTDTKTFFNDTWTFNSATTTWTKVNVTNGPSGRIGAQMAYDATSSKVILFGGIDASTLYPANDTWAFDAIALTWTKL